MSPAHPPRPDFDTVWETLGLDDEAVATAQTQTISLAPTRVLDDSRPATLPPLVGERGGDDTRHVTVRDTIAEGGMGVIHLGTQLALKREVAIKQLRSDRKSETAAAELLHEAWLVGMLEHPNIIPIYMLGRDDNGDPAIVMKRIKGTSWGTILRGDAHAEGPGDEDPLEWHLDVLMNVCNAVHFAHDRGILHRDLKPDNVMIGSFGEVYLLDWGIAVSLDDDDSGRFRARSEANEVAGTPAYMAPEMVMGDGSRLQERTDVYLLGAMLHEIVTGDVLHSGETVYEVMYSVYRAEPYDYGDGVDAELAEICRRATARNPEDRFESADALRRALADYLRHRHSLKATAEALEALVELRELVNEPDHDPVEVHRRYGGIRFGLESALSDWPDNGRAAAGLEEAHRLIAESAVVQDDLRSARVFLEELDSPPADLVEAVADMERRRSEKEQRLREFDRLRDDLDVSAGTKTRAWVAFLLGFDWSAGPIALFFYSEFVGPVSNLMLTSVVSVFWACAVATVFYYRDELLQNSVNRQIIGSVIVCAVSFGIVHILVANVADIPLELLAVFDLTIFGAITSMVALTIDRRVSGAVGAFLLGAITAAVWSDIAVLIFGLAILVAFGFIVWAWLPDDDPRCAFNSKGFLSD